ncbi:hypothetical protein [Moritella sp.]|uniref:hypothetical protein n=1 Tax=Moritella sp. TaxID=78556 RepID=UPI0025F42C24|nr:hypothetical protein [Moritella sp.]MCJ8352016.1 hypothetical protein [Moritella sp.]
MCNGNKDTLTEYKKQFLKDGKRPKPAELIFILAEHLKLNRPVNQHCTSIAADIQKKYGYWNEAGDPDQAAKDAISKALVYGITTSYPSDVKRREELEKMLGARIKVSSHNTRIISLE